MLIKFCQTFVAIQRHLNRRDAQIFAHDKLAEEKDAVGLRLEFRALDVHLGAVLGIRIRMFLGLQDPDPDPLVRNADPNPDPDPSLF